MDNLLRVDILQRVSYLKGDPDLAFQIAGMAILDGVPQVLADQKFHHHVRALMFVFAEIVNPQDVIVYDVACHAGFGKKPGLGFCILATLVGENLDGHRAANYRVPRPVDVRHAAAQKLLDLVFANSDRQIHLVGYSTAIGRTPFPFPFAPWTSSPRESPGRWWSFRPPSTAREPRMRRGAAPPL